MKDRKKNPVVQEIDIVKWNEELDRLIGEPLQEFGLSPLKREEIYKECIL